MRLVMTKMLPPKSLRGETEYRQSFKKSRFNCAATTYQNNLDFRTEQKRRFVEHNREPFAWNPVDVESSDSSSDQSCGEVGRSYKPTLTQHKHEKLNRLYEKRMNGKETRNDNAGEVRRVSTRDTVGHRDSEEEREESDEEGNGESGSESDSSVVHIIEPEFVKERGKRTVPSVVHPVANKETQTDRDRKHHQPRKKSSPPSPFLPYGYEANVTEMGKKLTHNVRATREVYPSALRAQKNRKMTEQQIHNRVKGSQPRVADHLRLTTSEPVRIFVHADDFDGPDWVTEYDRNYQLYDPNEYSRRPESARVHARELIPQLSGKARRQTRN